MQRPATCATSSEECESDVAYFVQVLLLIQRFQLSTVSLRHQHSRNVTPGFGACFRGPFFRCAFLRMSRQSAANSSREASHADSGSSDVRSLSILHNTSGPTSGRSSAATPASRGNFSTALMSSPADDSAGPSSAAQPAVVGQTPSTWRCTICGQT